MHTYFEEFAQIKKKNEIIGKENAGLRIEMGEILEQHDNVKTKFGALLDKFQEYIANSEKSILEREEQYE